MVTQTALNSFDIASVRLIDTVPTSPLLDPPPPPSHANKKNDVNNKKMIPNDLSDFINGYLRNFLLKLIVIFTLNLKICAKDMPSFYLIVM
jgi:hypothetical protein